MKVLVHYTTNYTVFSDFSNSECEIKNTDYVERFNEIEKYYKRCNSSQNILLFVVQYRNLSNSEIKFVIGKIYMIDENTYNYIRIEEDVSDLLIKDLGLNDFNTYTREIYYKEYFIDKSDEFYSRKINDISNKIKLKYFSWPELLQNNEILHNKLIDILFDKDNVLNLATIYNPKKKFGENKQRILNEKYVSALKNIGFISEKEIDINKSVLHGDIGEFLMDVMICRFIELDGTDSYIFPKLAYKTTPNSAVHGNDGTLYNITKNEIYYSEAKFYEELSLGLSKAVDSLFNHDNRDYDFINSNIDAFRNITDNSIGEVVEITKDVKEKLIVFLMCDDKYFADDVSKTIERSKKLEKLEEFHEIIIFVLPVLNKENFLNLFKKFSEQKGKELIYGK